MSLIKLNNFPKINLLNVDFNYLGIEEEVSQKNIDLKITDEFVVRDYDSKRVHLEFTRKVFFEPEIFYDILVKVNAIYELNEEAQETLNKENLEKEINKDIEILDPVLEKVSLLIGNITNIDDDLTLVTPPFFHQDHEL